MRRGPRLFALAAALAVFGACAALADPAAATTFSNPSSIALRDPNTGVSPTCSGGNCATAATYPSTIPVTGQTGTVSNVTLSLNNVSYAFSDDIDALLVGPGGQSLIVVAAVGPNSGAAEAVSNSTLTISDAGTLPTDVTPWGSASTFKPANFGSFGLGNSLNGFNETYISPAPAAPWGDPGQHGTNATLANVFNGTSPNGTWSLYVITTSAGDGTGAISGGWTLNVTTAAAAAATTTAITSSVNPSFTSSPGGATTLTATVHKTSDNSNVNEGTVAFTDGGVTIPGCGAVSVSVGTASCINTFTTEGAHTVAATYSGTPNFGSSSNSLTQVVNNHTTVTGSNYCNTGSIALNNPTTPPADATPYPSDVFVSGLSGTISHLRVTLNSATYSHSQDIDVLLVGPGGHSLIVVANFGPDSGTGTAASNDTLAFDDSGPLPVLGRVEPWDSGPSFKPVNYGGFNETWGPPAPLGPYGDPGTMGTGATFASQFNGTIPNGTWQLYVITTAPGDGTGAIAGGWCATFTTAVAAPTTTTVTSGNNPSFASTPGNAVPITATVTQTSDGSTVSEGSVIFTDGGTPIPGCGGIAVGAGGTASCNTSFTVEGNHQIQAQYSGTANFGSSNDSLTQVVNDHTTVTGNSYCNTGSIALNNPPSTVADATPYPSDVFVTGRPGNLQHLAVTLNNATYSHSQDIDALLVGPGGQTFILAAAAGPNTGAISNVTLTLDDNAGATLPQNAIWGAPNSSVTFKPANYGGLNETWGPPAPAGPYGNPGPFGGGTATLGSTFDGASPNGTWSLYLITTAAGDGTGAVAGGWCLGITSPAPPTLTKSFGAASIPQGGSTSLSFTVGNPNASSSLTGVGFTDTLPAGLSVATPNGLSGNCGGGTITAAGGTVALSGAMLLSSASCMFSVNVTASSAGAKVNTTSAPVSNEGGNGTAATATLDVLAPPSLVKSFVPASVPLNGSTELILTLTNPNATASLTGVGYTDTLPAGLVVATNNMLSQSCIPPGTISAVPGSSLVSLSGATLAANASCTVSLAVTGTTAGAKVNTTSAVSSNEGGSGAPATATLDVVAGAVQITKAFGAATVPLGGSTSLGFTITNPAANSTETGIAFTDTLPAGVVVSTPNGLTGSCGGGTISAAPNATAVMLTGASLADGAQCMFSVNVTGTSAGVKMNSVTVSSAEGGTGNTSNASLTVVAPPSLTKTFGAPTIPLNGSTSLILTVTNPNATASLTGVGYTDTLPAGLVVATNNMLSQSCIPPGTISAVPGSSLVSLSGATLAANASCTISLNVTGVAAGPQVNTTSAVSSNEGGSGAPATATLDVVAGAVQITKAFGAATVPLGGSTSLGFTITNPAANGTETGIAFTDTLPAGVVVSTPNGLTGSCGGGTISAAPNATAVMLTGASLADGAQCMFSVNVTGTSAGVKMNSVTVSSTEGGTGNTSNASLTVVAPPSLTKTFGAPTIPLTGTTSLSFTASNPNTAASLSGVGFTDPLPAGLAVASPNGLTGSCGVGTITATAGATSVSLSGAMLLASSSCTFSVNVTGVAAGSQANTTSTIASNEGGSGAAATATLTVLAPPTIAKAFAPSSVALNGKSTLTITLTNPNPADALNGVSFTDTFPAGLVVASPSNATSTCANFNGSIGSGDVFGFGILLPAGASCTFSVDVTSTTSGPKNNSVSVTSTNGGTGTPATATLQVAGAPLIAKTFGAPTIPVGGSTSLSFTVTNPAGNGMATGVGFNDLLPAGVVVSTPNGLGGSCGGGTISAAPNATAVMLTGASLADGAQCMFSVNVTGTSAGVKNNSVTVSSTEGGTGNTSNASLTVVAPPSLTKTFGAPTIPLTGTTSLSFTASNPNDTVPLTGVGFTDPLPAGLTVASPSGLSGGCGGTITATAGSGSVSLSGGMLPAGGSCTFSVNVTGTAAGAQANTTSTIASNEGGSGAAATATLTVLAPPTIAKAFAPSSVALNGTSTLTITLTNPNPGNALNGVSFTDTFPAGLVVASQSGGTSTCTTFNETIAPGSLSANGVLLPAGSSCSFSINVTPTTVGVKNNSVSVTSTNGGPGNTAMASLTTAMPPQITKAFGAPTIPQGGQTSLRFTITNPAGNIDLTGIAFNDSLPAGMTVAAPNGLSGSCAPGTITAAGGTVSLAGASLDAGTSCTFAVNVTSATVGAANNSVMVTATESGPGNTALASLTVVAPPTITKAFGAATIPLGGQTSLRFTVGNPSGILPLTGVGFTDGLPAGLAVATPNGLTGSCGVGTITATPGAGSVSLTGATLTAGATCTFSVNVTGTAAGLQKNSVTASSDNGGSSTKADASVTVVAPPTITKSFGSPTIPFGTSTSLSFTVTNPNAGTALSGVGFTDGLPGGLVVATPNGLTGSCGVGTITATAGTSAISLTGANLPAAGSCTFSVNVTAVAVGPQHNTTSPVSSNEGGAGVPATADMTVGRAPTTTTLTATPPSVAFGSPVTFTATVAPAQANGSGTPPTGTVSFFVDGSSTAAATVALSGGHAAYTVSGLGAGSHTVVAVYNGDQNFLGSTSSPGTPVAVTCATTVTGTRSGTFIPGPGATCVAASAHLTGGVIIHAGSAVDFEGAQIDGSIDASDSPSGFRLCGSNVGGALLVAGATGFVLVGDPGDDACPSNTIHGSLSLKNNTHGLDAIGNHVAGSITITGNSGAGPFAQDTGPEVSGNGP